MIQMVPTATPWKMIVKTSQMKKFALYSSNVSVLSRQNSR